MKPNTDSVVKSTILHSLSNSCMFYYAVCAFWNKCNDFKYPIRTNISKTSSLLNVSVNPNYSAILSNS